MKGIGNALFTSLAMRPSVWGGKMVLVAVMIATICVCTAAEPSRATRILYINSYAPGYSWGDDIERGLFERFESSSRDIEISVEYLDAKRFPAKSQLDKRADHILEKYGAFPHDIVVVSDNAAFTFATGNRERLFPGLPIVFCGYNAFRHDDLKGMTNITGVNEEVDIGGLIDTAIYIQPDIGTLAFIISTDDASNMPMAEKAESSIIPKYQEHYEIVVLKNAPIAKIRDTLARIPRESAVVALGHTRETGDGRPLTPVEHGRLIAAASPVPVYTLWKFHLNTGVLGGLMLAGYDQGKAAADMALQILEGKSADSIPVIMKSPARNIFDYNVMKRFRIGMGRLPDDSTVINRPMSLYADHERVIWTSLMIIVVLTALIVVLLFNISSRRYAEKALRASRDNLEARVKERTAQLVAANTSLTDSEAKFRGLSDAAFEGIAMSEHGTILETNKTLTRMFGYEDDGLAGLGAIDIVPKAARQNVQDRIEAGDETPYHTTGLKKNGEEFPIEVHGQMLTFAGRRVRVTAIRDLTAEAAAEREIRVLRGILPTCQYCKKIRRAGEKETEPASWVAIEAYLGEHTEARFSHGICPDCMRQHVPDDVLQAYLSEDEPGAGPEV